MNRFKKNALLFIIVIAVVISIQHFFLRKGDREFFDRGNWYTALPYYHISSIFGNSNAKLKELALIRYYLEDYPPVHYRAVREENRSDHFYRNMPAPFYTMRNNWFKAALLTSSYFQPYLLSSNNLMSEEDFVGAGWSENIFLKPFLKKTLNSKDPFIQTFIYKNDIEEASSYEDSLFYSRKIREAHPQSGLMLYLAAQVTPIKELKDSLMQQAALRGNINAETELLPPLPKSYPRHSSSTLEEEIIINRYKIAYYRNNNFYAVEKLSRYYDSNWSPAEENPSLPNFMYWKDEYHHAWKDINYRYWYTLGNIRQFLAAIESIPPGYRFSVWLRAKTLNISYNDMILYFVIFGILLFEITVSLRKRFSLNIPKNKPACPNYTWKGRLMKRGKRNVSIRSK